MDLPVFLEVILFILVIIIAALLAALLSKKLLSGGGGTSNVVAGATADLLNAEKLKAVDNVLEQQAGKKMEEQESGQSK